MLISLPIVLACVGFQPCAAPTGQSVASPRMPVSAAVVTHDRRGELASTGTFLRDALARVPPPSGMRLYRANTQPPLMMAPRGRTSKAMYICALASAGAYAGAGVGWLMTKDSGGDSPGLAGARIGLPVGAIVGGLLGWKLVEP